MKYSDLLGKDRQIESLISTKVLLFNRERELTEEIKIIKEALVKHEKENVDLREKCNEMRSKNSDLEKVVSSLEVKVLVNAEDRYNLKLKVNFLEDNLRCIIRSIV